MSRPRALAVAVGALVLLLALSPFVPRGGSDDDGALRPSGDGLDPKRPALAPID